jgi:hypothetical protein
VNVVKRPNAARFLDLRVAVERRLQWARDGLASDEYSDMEKVWMRRYEIDVKALLDAMMILERDG